MLLEKAETFFSMTQNTHKRRGTMKHLLFAILFSLPPSLAFAQLSIERSVDLGFGFRRVTVAEPVSVSLEGIGHFEYLYYEDRKLCRLANYSISPSGRFAIYQDERSNLFLFCRDDEKVFRLAQQSNVPANKVAWHESLRTVEVHYERDHPTQTFPLR
jgi:hypothetical protein